jgi:adenylate cyclase
MTVTTRHFRLASGLVMLTYLLTHLVNHSLGNFSLDLAESGLKIAKSVWQSSPGTIALYTAAGVHIALALRTIYERRHWDLPIIEWIRLFAGFTLPTLLIRHAVDTRIGATLYEYDANYRNVIATILATGSKGWQFGLLAPGWLHGCLGVWLTLRRFDWAVKAKPFLIAFMFALPLASALGFANMVDELNMDPSGGAGYYAPQGDYGKKLMASLGEWKSGLLQLYFGLVITAFVAGRIRDFFFAPKAHH